ncbi:MAG: hypothetical protein ABEJ07_01810 [Candidatus Nanohaloarchaea archaeon]
MKLETKDLKDIWLDDHHEIPGIPCPECGFGLTLPEAAYGDCGNCGAKLELKVKTVSSGGEK